MIIAAIPSPTTSVWHLGPFPLRAYALCIIAGMVVATLLMEQRLRHRGVAPWTSLDMVVWAVPFGIVGARVYHLITSPQDYFGAGGDPIRAFYIWEGGLGIWGAVIGGALGAWIAARQIGLPLSIFADTLAPALPVAQAIGRLGNWFNNELYGKVTTLPWGLEIHEMDSANPGHATVIDGEPVTKPDLYHPTFLYELIWNLGAAALVWLLDRKFKFGRGRAFAIYVMAYTAGRFWIEMLRTDEANTFFGIRLNVFTAVVIFVGAAIYFAVVRGPRDYVVPIDAPGTGSGAAPGTASGAGSGTAAGAGSQSAASGDVPSATLAATLGTAPANTPATTREPAAGGGVSQVDVSGDTGGAPAKVPVAYQVVSEERFETYRRTGVLPPAPESPAVPAGEDDVPVGSAGAAKPADEN